MNLYLISQDENSGYDTYDSAVVVAPDAEAALHCNPGGGTLDWEARDTVKRWTAWAYNREAVKVSLIGVAAEGVAPGVVCASFNAG